MFNHNKGSLKWSLVTVTPYLFFTLVHFLILLALYTLIDILIIPKITANLLSIAKCVKDNMCLIEFNLFGYVVKYFITKTSHLMGPIRNNLFPMQIPIHFKNHLVFATHQVSFDLWHQNLGHPCAQTVIPQIIP